MHFFEILLFYPEGVIPGQGEFLFLNEMTVKLFYSDIPRVFRVFDLLTKKTETILWSHLIQ